MPTPKNQSNYKKAAGDKFEQEIAELYIAMGYSVSRHVSLSGQEVDIVAEQTIPGGGPLKIIVECKFKKANSLAGNADVQSIAGAFHVAKANNMAVACTLVTTNGFTLQAQEAAKTAGITLLTKTQLMLGLVDFSVYFQGLKRAYTNDFGSKEITWYINPKLRRNNEVLDSLDDFVDNWLQQKKKKPLAILGGYGTGKTSFCRHYADRILNRSESLIPVVVSLREFQKMLKSESLIRDFLEEQCRTQSPRFGNFWRMYCEGLILLMFDGFDEMATRVDATTLEINLLEIEKFARVGGNVILTCRPEFFVTQKEERGAWFPYRDILSNRMAIYNPVEIELWEPQQIEIYVRRRVAGMKPRPRQDADFYLERITQLPELADVSSRAVHLELIVKVLPNLMDKQIPITRPNLYRNYIEREFRRETVLNKRLRIIADEERLRILQRVASDRFADSKDNLEFEAAASVIKTEINPPKPELESFTRDFLNRSFLRRNGDIYSFAHKSIGEFLFACEIHERMLKGDMETIDKKRGTAAVAGMVLELFGGVSSFQELLRCLEIGRECEIVPAVLHRVAFAALSLFDYTRGVMFISRLGKLRAGHSDVVSRRYAGLTHDLNNLNAVILMACDIVVDSDEETRKLLAMSTRNWKHLLDMVDELNRFSVNRLNFTVQFSLQRKKIQINNIVQQALACISAEKVSINGKCRPFQGDELYLYRAFANIAWNAKHAIQERGTVSIEIGDDDVANGVRICFTNTGPPISSDVIGRIFDFGFSTRKDGHGMGLAITKDMLNLHGGTISVRSDNDGTAFDVFLPRMS